MVMGLPMVRDLDGKRRYVHVEKKKLRAIKVVVRVHFMRSCRKAAGAHALLDGNKKEKRVGRACVCECVERLHVLSFGMGLWVPVCRAF